MDFATIGVTVKTAKDGADQPIGMGQSQRFATNQGWIDLNYQRDAHNRGQRILAVDVVGLLSPSPKNVIALDAQYDTIAPSSWVVIQRADEEQPRLGLVAKAASVAKTDYNFPAGHAVDAAPQ